MSQVLEPNIRLPHPDRQVDNLHHLERIAAAMIPDPREYEYTGEVRDLQGMTGRCACGHAIRYEFPVRHKTSGKEVVIGSVCIDSSVPWLLAHGAEKLAEDLRKALEANEEAKKEALRQLRDARNSAEVVVLEAFFSGLKDWHKQARADWRETNSKICKRWDYYTRSYVDQTYTYYPDFLYRHFPTVKAQSTPGRTAASLRSKIVTLALAALDAGVAFPRLPDDPKLREKIKKELQDKVMYSSRRVESAQKYNYGNLDNLVEDHANLLLKIEKFRENVF